MNDEEFEIMRPKFEYEYRLFNHFLVNKMTSENQAFATINRGSFLENAGDKARMPDYTVDSENINPINPKHLQARLSSPKKNGREL